MVKILCFVLQYLLVFVPVSPIFCDECLRFDWLVMEGICADSLIVPTLWSLFLPHTDLGAFASQRSFLKSQCSFLNQMFFPSVPVNQGHKRKDNNRHLTSISQKQFCRRDNRTTLYMKIQKHKKIQLPAPFCLVDPNSLCSSNRFHLEWFCFKMLKCKNIVMML